MLFVNLFLTCFFITCSIFLFRYYLHKTGAVIHLLFDWLDDRVHLHQHIKIPEFNASTHHENDLYRRVLLYINSLPSLENSDFVNLFSGKDRNEIILAPENDELIRDLFLGARLTWVYNLNPDSKTKSVILKIKKKDKRRILKPYLQHIHTVSDEIDEKRKQLRLYNNVRGEWHSVLFDHPASFDSLVIDTELKNKVKNELESFSKSDQYYNKLGRVWKRSYLLYGPSGTGKSSFIASVANFLNYDVYNLNLSQVGTDSDLNSLLLQAKPKSLMVIEDMDTHDESSVSLSGLMNFMDGLLNFQSERIMIFTANRKDKIGSSLLRPGRIDVHIHFPNCDFNSFKNLATNYLGVKEHKLFQQVEEIFHGGATMSPAEISELMLVNRNSPSRALKSVIWALQSTGGKCTVQGSESAASSPAPPYMVAEMRGAWKESVPKEFRKLYGLFKMKSCRDFGSSDHEAIER